MKLQTITCSTRPGRVGPSISNWFNALAIQQGGFDSEVVDLADFNLPVYDEPNHPRLQKYEHQHTKAWSRSVNNADAYVFVIPEYNFCPPPSFINALNFVYNEWSYKPCGFVSYGGVSGGLRSAQQAKQLVTAVKMMPMVEGVTIQKPWESLSNNREFIASDHHTSSANAMLVELARWANALKTLR